MTSTIPPSSAPTKMFAMPSNNNRNGHVVLLRESHSNSSAGDDDNIHRESVNPITKPLQPQSHGNIHIPVPDTVDFGCTDGSTDRSQYHNNGNPRCNHTDAYNMNHVGPPQTMPRNMIDNRHLPYVPIPLKCGVCVYCSPDVLSSCPMVLSSLQADVTRVLQVLPPSVHSLVKRTNIWVNASYSYGNATDPQVLRHLTTHHQEGWLVECARDNPCKAGGIEVYSCFDFEKMRLHWNGSGLLLHELCHLIHQHCLEDGLDNPRVQALYEQAKSSGKYENVLRRDWAGLEEDYDLAYAMVDKKEFFAELSVAFLCHGYTNLNNKDCKVMEECCPPLIHPVVMERVMKLYGIQNHPLDYDDHADESNQNLLACWWTMIRGVRGAKPKVRIADPIFAQAAISRCCINVHHCNKFYPFTRGQFRKYDPELYRGIRDLWNEVSMWEDPEAPRKLSCFGP